MQSDGESTMRRFKTMMRQIESLVVRVGIPSGIPVKEPPERKRNEKESPKDVAAIAFLLNYGSFSDHIPDRPFGTTTVPRYKNKIKNVLREEMAKYLMGRQSLKKAYGRVGLEVESDMKHNLRFGGWTANKPLTIARKGSSQPLIDTGQMRQSITHIVVDKNEVTT